MPYTYSKDPTTFRVLRRDSRITDAPWTTWEDWSSTDHKEYSGVKSYESFVKQDQYYGGPKVKGAEHDALWYINSVNDEIITHHVSFGQGLGITRSGPASMIQVGPSPDNSAQIYLSSDEAVLRALKSISDGKASLAVSAAEFGETVESIANIVKTLHDLYVSIKRRDYNKFKKVLRDRGGPRKTVLGSAASYELEYRYAIRPLLSDVDALVKALADRYERHLDIVNGKGSCSAKAKVFNPAQLPNDSKYVSSSHEIELSYRVFLEGIVTNPAFRSCEQLGLANPLSVAWELVPLSFVADWLLPIGDYLGSLSLTSGLSFKKGFVTSKRVETYKRGNLTMKNVSYNRSVYSSFPSYPFPTPHLNVNGWRVADAVSLLYQAYSKS